MDTIQTQFQELLASNGLQLNERQLEQFDAYFRILVEWNVKMNLTGITERDQVYIKHFYDSLTLAFFMPMEAVRAMADIGSGAGFPGIPLKIVFPHLQLTIVDSLQKRIHFLEHLTSELSLSDVSCVHGRAEDVARSAQHRDRYDLVTARAVARLAVLNELCLPFVCQNGMFVAMKGSGGEEELAEADLSLQQLHGKLERKERLSLPVEDAGRTLFFIRKTASTPAKYPRKAGMPAKEPLVRK
ncbi:16S rRNA (guanine(527)-N(7))-methyltransferase RsmG [Gordoniibacillus kamchatkensis]|uniref:16S rRNA (guanine(527)-N(7))-methyltransferase RsmG n=1 Tax=Gordoniibacillus kamchatkensis TaxID=1590651 RepID=UPI0018CDB872|nr:16S rRNA (guanine(527)-N(7))-methyltransferase RsmG [Paenibacillus sp. VKM B-2647]